MASQCNQCGSFEKLTQCEDCTTILCANCNPGHAKTCADMRARKARGDGQTVRRVNTLPEPKAEMPKPELIPVVDPKQDAVNSGVPPVDVIASLAGEPDLNLATAAAAASLGLAEAVTGATTLEPNEGPFMSPDTIGKELGIVSEGTQDDSQSKAVLQSEQVSDTSSVADRSGESNASPESDPSTDGGNAGNAGGDSDNSSSAPEPEVADEFPDEESGLPPATSEIEEPPADQQ